MKIVVRSGNVENLSSQAIIVPVFSDIKNNEEDFKKLDNILGRALSKAIESDQWLSQEGHFEAFFTNKRMKTDRVILAGLGKSSDLTSEKIRVFGGRVISFLKNRKIKDASILAFSFLVKDTSVEDVTDAFCQGVMLGDYSFDVYKSQKQKSSAKSSQEKEESGAQGNDAFFVFEQFSLIPQHTQDSSHLSDEREKQLITSPLRLQL